MLCADADTIKLAGFTGNNVGETEILSTNAVLGIKVLVVIPAAELFQKILIVSPPPLSKKVILIGCNPAVKVIVPSRNCPPCNPSLLTKGMAVWLYVPMYNLLPSSEFVSNVYEPVTGIIIKPSHKKPKLSSRNLGDIETLVVTPDETDCNALKSGNTFQEPS